MNKIRRMLAMCLACALLLSAMALPASANNNTDTDFMIAITDPGKIHKNSKTVQRAKYDASSSYINYGTWANGTPAWGVNQFEAFIYGSRTYGGKFEDCSSETYNGYKRSRAIVNFGTRGLIRQDIWEKFYKNDNVYPYGQIYGASVGYAGRAEGCWSVDSVGDHYQYYNYVL